MIDYSKMITAEDKLEETKDIARSGRDMYLAKSDWVVIRSQELGEPIPDEWLAYRQALRDITEQPGFPEDIEWPEPPK